MSIITKKAVITAMLSGLILFSANAAANEEWKIHI